MFLAPVLIIFPLERAVVYCSSCSSSLGLEWKWIILGLKVSPHLRALSGLSSRARVALETVKVTPSFLNYQSFT